MSAKLGIDLGNTLSKAMFWHKSGTHGPFVFNLDNPIELQHLLDVYMPSKAMVSAVREIPASLFSLVNRYCPLEVLSHQTPLPFSIAYKTPETLGRDRIAVVAAAFARFGKRNVLVIDMGTCITYDLLTAEGTYLGGSISPGIIMRAKAMHHFTHRLPLVEPSPDAPLIGQTTAESIQSGVVNGTNAEIESIIRKYRRKYPELVVLVGGGDNIYFETKFKSRIFAASNLVLEGLLAIMEFNNKVSR